MKRLLIAITLVALPVAIVLTHVRPDRGPSTALVPSVVPKPTTRAPRPDPVKAAAQFLSSLTPDVLLDDARRARVLSHWADPAAKRALAQTYVREADRVRAAFGGRPVVSRSALLGYRVEKSARPTIAVAIWAVGFSVGRTGVSATGWSTITVALRPRNGSWRVVSVSSAPGPAPTEPADRLAAAASSFQPFSHAR
jgi:hypothetical protein